ncbi:MAG: hypothetical protein RLY87_1764 [Chloroflexota bacterium]|jgi:hypothetical protein
MTLFRTLWQQQRFLVLISIFHIAMIPVVMLLYVVAPIEISGVNAWIKPLKFDISSAVYALSIAWIATLFPKTSRWYTFAGITIALSLIIETSLITVQVARGTMSHYNISTSLDTVIYSFMATFISILATANIVCLGVVVSQKAIARVVRIACSWGLGLALVGMIAGVLMTSVNVSPSQLHTMQVEHKAPTTYGAHSVGVDDGGPGLPLVGWSTVGGDLRVGHFVGLHGLQVLPLFAFVLLSGRVVRRSTPTQKEQLVHVVGTGYAAMTILLIWQAWRAQPVISPDHLTTSVIVAIGAAMLVSGWLILRLSFASQHTQ